MDRVIGNVPVNTLVPKSLIGPAPRRPFFIATFARLLRHA